MDQIWDFWDPLGLTTPEKYVMLSKNSFKESQLTFCRGRTAKVSSKRQKMVAKAQNMG